MSRKLRIASAQQRKFSSLQECGENPAALARGTIPQQEPQHQEAADCFVVNEDPLCSRDTDLYRTRLQCYDDFAPSFLLDMLGCSR